MTTHFTISIITTVDPAVRGTATASMALDSPAVVTVTHDILDGGVRRAVADATGIVESTVSALDHACLSCAIREDVLPTLVRLRGEHRWEHAVVALPVTAEPAPLVRLLDHELRPGGALAGATFGTVAAVVDADTIAEDAFSDDGLDERGLALHEEDDRVVAEALSPMLLAADVVVLATESRAHERAHAVADHLRGDGAQVVAASLDRLTPVLLARPRGRLRDCLERVDPLRPARRTLHDRAGVWTLRLSSDQPFHPARLRENVERLAGHRVRAHGHFWVAGRPESACAWLGAGRQLSVGECGSWEGRTPRTELLVTGTGGERATIAEAFTQSLGQASDAPADSLEDWLGAGDGGF